jgi:hypothetical protein
MQSVPLSIFRFSLYLNVIQAVALVVVLTWRSEFNAIDCPLKLVNGTYTRLNPRKPVCIPSPCPDTAEDDPDVSVIVNGAIRLGKDAVIRSSKTAQSEYEFYYGSQSLFRLFNSSVIFGAVRPRRVSKGRLYISGYPAQTRYTEGDFADVESEFYATGTDGSTIAFQFVRSRVGGRNGWRIKSLDGTMYTVLFDSPQFIFGTPPIEYISANPSAVFITPTSAQTPQGLRCVDSLSMQGEFSQRFSSISITSLSQPSTCSRYVRGAFSSTRILLTSTAPIARQCVSALTISAVSANMSDVIAYPDVCFAANACSRFSTGYPDYIVGTQKNSETGATANQLSIPTGCSSGLAGAYLNVVCEDMFG